MPSEAEAVEARAYRVQGRVQGVGFRWWARMRAEEIGIGGTVRNLSDGSVEVRAAGTSDRLARFEDMLRKGPRFARVDTVEAVEPLPIERPDEFRIEHSE